MFLHSIEMGQWFVCDCEWLVAYGVASGVLPKQWRMLLVVWGHPWVKRDKATSWIGTIPLKEITPPQHIRIHTTRSCLLICLICYLLISYLEGGTSHHIPSLTSGNKAPHTHEARSEVPWATRSRFSACGRTIFWRMLSFNNRNRTEAKISLMLTVFKILESVSLLISNHLKASKTLEA